VAGLVSAAVFLLLLWIGLAGPRDPAENLLPLTVWTLWWVVLLLLSLLLGDLWGRLNPFAAIASLVRRRGARSLDLPATLDYVPALIIFAGFAWFQLVDPRPEDPQHLAVVAGAYGAFTLAAVLAFGLERWLARADPFAIFFRLIGAVAPLGQDGNLRPPGAGLLGLEALPPAGVLFVLLTLSSISFDGFANTFLWLAGVGVNPLDFPGRTAMMAANTLGLAGAFLILALLFLASLLAGWLWAGRPAPLRLLAGRLVLTLIPIAAAYHFAHYLGDMLLNLQYAVAALNDPLGTGADLLGLGQVHVTASFQNTASGALAMFSLQTIAIVAGHAVSVLVAHAMAVELGLPRRQLWRLELPLAAFMVLYTAFGLWLLSAPAIA
jgi:hypothetical protein